MPDRIGRYEVIRKIARGGSGSVYLANDPQAKRQVAIKVIKPDLLSDRTQGPLHRALLQNEKALVGKLDHLNVVQLYDVVVSDDENSAYVVMEYVDGGTLEHHCEPNRLLSVTRVVESVFQCAAALNFAFHLGITHRDIKPANILIEKNGAVKVSDFGVALLNSQDNTQVSGVGSPIYMSPEQVREQPLDQRTDIYSLGVVMYQLLTGRLPFEGRNTYQIVHQIINGTPLPPSVLRPAVPNALEAIIVRAMEKDIDQRYQNWEEFIEDLAELINGGDSFQNPHEPEDEEKFHMLRGFPFFSDFSDPEIWEAVRFGAWKTVASGGTIVREGDASDCFFFVTSGVVQIVKQEKVLNLLVKGDCFGETAIVGKKRRLRTASAIALHESRVIAIHSDALERASIGCRLHFSQALAEVLIQRLIIANTLTQAAK